MTQGDLGLGFVSLRERPADVDTYRAAPPFAVSLSKLVVMSLVTFGIYDLYWAYKHWKAERQREQEDLYPFWRAFFAPLWGFSLFGRVRRLAERHGRPVSWSAGWLGFAYLILGYVWRLPDPYWLVSLLAFLPLLPVQASLNQLNAELTPGAPRNDSYSGLNVVMIVIGSLLLALALIGTFMPTIEPDVQVPVVV